MTNRLLDRPRQTTAGSTRRSSLGSNGRPGSLIVGVVGLIGLRLTRPAGPAAPDRRERVLLGRRGAARVSRPARPGSQPQARAPGRSRPTTCTGTSGSASSTACRGRSWPGSARSRATTARPPCPACTAGRTASARPARCRSASAARPATSGAARRSTRPAKWSTAWPPTRTAARNASVYDPADAIAGAARYLVAAGVQTNPSGAIFAYNHLQSYVQSVLFYAGQYAGGNYSVVGRGHTVRSTVAGCST